MTRRELLLSGASFFALLALLPSSRSDSLIGGVGDIPFNGNPNVIITAIDTSGGIATSRTSGLTPCFVQVSASGITAIGTPVPYEDLSYSWNFGDQIGTEIFANPATGAKVNANTSQTGPEAAYCYRNAGTYVVTLTVSGKAAVGYITATATQTITVKAFSATTIWYYDQHATGANNGTSPTNAFTDLTTLAEKAAAAASPTSIFLARGSHWIGAYAFTIRARTRINGLRIGAYTPASRATADPIIEADSGSPDNLWLFYNGSESLQCPITDMVISNLSLVRSGTFTGGIISVRAGGNSVATFSNIYLDNLSVTSNVLSPLHTGWASIMFNPTVASGLFDNAGWWGGSINSSPGDRAYGTGFYGGAADWTFIVGLTNVNGSGGATFSQFQHHIYASVHNHALFRWINFGAGATRNYCMKIDNYPSPQKRILGTSAGTDGVVRLQVADTNGFSSGAPVYVEFTGGTTEANGGWICSIIDHTHLDLVGTVYSSPWTSGGTVCPYAQAKYWLVDGCNITGTARSFDAQNNQADTRQSTVVGYIVQNCSINNLLQPGLASVPIALSFTLRDSNYWNNRSYGLFIPSQGNQKNPNGIFRIYRNNFYIPANASITLDPDNGAVQLPRQGTFKNPQQLTDNTFQDMRANAAAIKLSYSSHAALGSKIDRNRFYTPNALTNKFLFNNTITTTFAAWQAAGFDAHGQQLSSPPNWCSPTTGNFDPC